MQVILHTGVHATDEGRILRGLARNATAWRAEGVAIPHPSRYRTLLSDAVQAMARGCAAPDARDVLEEAILAGDPSGVDRMILSHENLFCVPKRVFRGGILYARAEERVEALQTLFAGDALGVFMGLRNPATFLPAVFSEAPQDTLAAFLEGFDPDTLRWSDLVRRLRAASPGVPLTLWANEESPFLWGQILREMAGIELTRRIRGSFDLLAEIMLPDGMRRFRAHLARNPGIDERQKRAAMVAFLGTYAIDDALEEELDLPRWTPERVAAMTEAYERDLDVIAGLSGVRMLVA